MQVHRWALLRRRVEPSPGPSHGDVQRGGVCGTTRGYSCAGNGAQAISCTCVPGYASALIGLSGSCSGSSGGCAMCGAGSYCLGGAIQALNCTSAPGYACGPGSGAAAGRMCAAGQFCTGGAAMAAACASAVGAYCPAGSSSTLGIPCPPGATCAGGASAPVLCSAAGYWCAVQGGNVTAVMCAPGVFGTASNAATYSLTSVILTFRI